MTRRTSPLGLSCRLFQGDSSTCIGWRMSEVLELFQADQRTVAGRNHLLDRVRVFESGTGDHTDDVCVESKSSITSRSQRSGECDGAGWFGEDTFFKSEAALSVPDFFIGDDVAAAAGRSTFGDGPMAVVERWALAGR